MKNNNCLSTRTEKCCPQCGEEFVLVDPTDVLASRPVQVDLICPDCHFPGRATLTERNRFHSFVPSPAAIRPIANDNDAWLTASAYDPFPRFRRSVPEPNDEATHLTLVP